jgi:hypothetical protein
VRRFEGAAFARKGERMPPRAARPPARSRARSFAHSSKAATRQAAVVSPSAVTFWRASRKAAKCCRARSSTGFGRSSRAQAPASVSETWEWGRGKREGGGGEGRLRVSRRDLKRPSERASGRASELGGKVLPTRLGLLLVHVGRARALVRDAGGARRAHLDLRRGDGEEGRGEGKKGVRARSGAHARSIARTHARTLTLSRALLHSQPRP